MKLSTDLSDVIQLLLKKESQEEDWVWVANHYQWKSQDETILIDIIKSTGSQLFGDILVSAILESNKLNAIEHFEEVYQQLNSSNFHTIDAIIKKIDDNGKWFGDENWWLLAVKFANKAIDLLHKSNNQFVWQAVADNHQWDTIHPWFARAIALWAFNHEHGQILLAKLIPLRILHIEDYSETNLAKITEPHIRWNVYEHICHLTLTFKRRDLLENIAHKLVPPVEYPPINYRDTTNNPFPGFYPKWWRQVMNSQRCLWF